MKVHDSGMFSRHKELTLCVAQNPSDISWLAKTTYRALLSHLRWQLEEVSLHEPLITCLFIICIFGGKIISRLESPPGWKQNPGSVSPLSALQSSARWRSSPPATLDWVHQGRPGLEKQLDDTGLMLVGWLTVELSSTKESHGICWLIN